MKIKIIESAGNIPGRLADAEIHFDTADGILAGLKLIGFSVWERRGGGGGYNVTFPARQYSVNGERRSFALLRPIADAGAQNYIRDAIIGAYKDLIRHPDSVREGTAAREIHPPETVD